MFKHLFILFILLFNSSMNSLFPVNLFSKSIDPTFITKTGQKAYMNNGDWAYLRTILTKVNSCQSKTETQLNTAKTVSIISAFILSIATMASLAIDKCTISEKIPSLIAISISIFTIFLSKNLRFFLLEKIDKERVFKFFELILDKYNPDQSLLGRSGNVNTKTLIPVEFHGSFDELYNVFIVNYNKTDFEHSCIVLLDNLLIKEHEVLEDKVEAKILKRKQIGADNYNVRINLS